MAIPEEAIQNSSFAIIPSYILDDEDLDEGAKNLYARISMYSKDGRCWATNAHFAEKHKVTARHIQKWLQQLKDKNYIEVEVITEGIQTRRNIWIQGQFKEKFKGRHIGHPSTSYTPPTPVVYDTQINNIYKYKEDNTPPTPSKEGDCAPEAREVASLFFEKIKENNPGHKEPDIKKWTQEIDRLLRIDKRDYIEMRLLLQWALQDPFWKTVILSPKKFREKYDQLLVKMQSTEKKDRVQRNRSYAIELKNKFPKEMSAFSFDDKFAYNKQKSKEILFDLPEEQFKSALIQMFGGEYV